jgi:uncharacterized lipoprotein
MSPAFRLSRPLLLGAVILAMATASGCSWFRSKSRADYTASQENRPLEVPPDLDLPDTSASTVLPSAANLGSGVTTRNAGVLVAGGANAVWAKVGELLGGIDGLEVTGRAEALRSYDVSFQGQSFLIRVEEAGGQSRIAAISADGQVLSGGAAGQVLRALKEGL